MAANLEFAGPAEPSKSGLLLPDIAVTKPRSRTVSFKGFSGTILLPFLVFVCSIFES